MHKLKIEINRSRCWVECPKNEESVHVYKACAPGKTVIVDSCIFFRGIDFKEGVEYVKCGYPKT